MNRESRIADMVIHGWDPVRVQLGVGVGNRDLGIGFVSEAGDRWGGLDSRGVRRISVWLDATWDDIPDEILDRIEARLVAV